MEESESKVPSKRKRNAKNEENEECKRQRGRPRLDPQDKTAADRRRTQIRNAQRAYRMRKETTIAALTQRTSVLEGMIEEMKRTLFKLNDQANKADIPRLKPEFAQSLSVTAQRFASLAQEATASHHDDSEDGVGQTLLEEQRSDSEPLPKQSQNQTAMPMPTSIQWTPPASDQGEVNSPEQAAPTSAPIIGLGYQLVYEDPRLTAERMEPITLHQAFGPDLAEAPRVFGPLLNEGFSGPATSLNSGRLPQPDHRYGMVRTVKPHYRFDIHSGQNQPSSSLNRIKSLHSPHTYSFQETTFARRLQRAAIETGYKLALHASLRPGAFKHVFRLLLLWESRDQIVERFKSLLLKTTNESLDYWATPFLHIGGAGTHYARCDANGNVVPKPNSYIVRSIGPQRIAKLGNATGTGMTPDMFIDIMGLEGEWFDPNDVEGYLRERGFVIHPQSSFAEGRISDRSASPLSFWTSGSTSTEGSPPLTPQSHPPFQSHPSAALYLEMNNSYNNNPSGAAVLSYENYPNSAFHPSSRTVSMATGSSLNPGPLVTEPYVTIDVQQFIDDLVHRVSCLGRSAGFRRADVDLALASAVQAF